MSAQIITNLKLQNGKSCNNKCHNVTQLRSKLTVNPLMPTVAIWLLATAIKHPVPDRVKPSIVMFDIRPERQSARMSNITNDGLTRFGTGCFIAVLI